MAASSVTGPLVSTAGFQVGTEPSPTTVVDASGNITGTNGTFSGTLGVTGVLTATGGVVGAVTGAATSISTGAGGAAGSYNELYGTKTGVADATATKICTFSIPNVNAGAGGTILCTSVTTQAGHIGDSVRNVFYTFSIERVAGNVAVMTITILTGGTTIATSGAGGAYTITSTLGAAAVSGGATAVNTFDIQVTNTGSTATTTTVTYKVELNNALAGGVTVAN